MATHIEKVNILLVDNDRHIAALTLHNLRGMGFRRIQHVSDTAAALTHILKHPVDMVITEWQLAPMTGIDLVRHLRMSSASPNRSLPIMMLTGRGEYNDVIAARDSGITEFVVKPFSIFSLFKRLENLVDSPRPFVVSESFVGPERRRRTGEIKTERRNTQARKLSHPPAEIPMPEKVPLILPADYAMRRAMGLNAPLASVITSEILNKTQEAMLVNMQGDALGWLREDLAALEYAFHELECRPTKEMVTAVQSAALLIKSRAGSFGMDMPSEVARMFYGFLNSAYDPEKPLHHQVARKFVEALRAIFGVDIKIQKAVAHELIKELEQLVLRTVK